MTSRVTLIESAAHYTAKTLRGAGRRAVIGSLELNGFSWPFVAQLVIIAAFLIGDPGRLPMNVEVEVRDVLGKVLQLGDRTQTLHSDSRLLGALPELDSMAVVAVIT